MGALSQLLHRANPANSANPARQRPPPDSQDSQAIPAHIPTSVRTIRGIRTHSHCANRCDCYQSRAASQLRRGTGQIPTRAPRGR